MLYDAQVVVGVGTLIRALDVGEKLRAKLGPRVDGVLWQVTEP